MRQNINKPRTSMNSAVPTPAQKMAPACRVVGVGVGFHCPCAHANHLRVCGTMIYITMEATKEKTKTPNRWENPINSFLIGMIFCHGMAFNSCLDAVSRCFVSTTFFGELGQLGNNASIWLVVQHSSEDCGTSRTINLEHHEPSLALWGTPTPMFSTFCIPYFVRFVCAVRRGDRLNDFHFFRKTSPRRRDPPYLPHGQN